MSCLQRDRSLQHIVSDDYVAGHPAVLPAPTISNPVSSNNASLNGSRHAEMAAYPDSYDRMSSETFGETLLGCTYVPVAAPLVPDDADNVSCLLENDYPAAYSNGDSRLVGRASIGVDAPVPIGSGALTSRQSEFSATPSAAQHSPANASGHLSPHTLSRNNTYYDWPVDDHIGRDPGCDDGMCLLTAAVVPRLTVLRQQPLIMESRLHPYIRAGVPGSKTLITSLSTDLRILPTSILV